MALTISQSGSGTITSAAASVATGATVTASVGDWLVVIVAASNDGTNGASSIGSVTDSDAVNSYTNRATINYDPGAAGAGATLRITTCAVTSALSNDTVSCSFSPNTSQASIQVYRVQPGASDTITFSAADTTGSTGATSPYTAATVSVTNGYTIFGAAALETDDTVTGDSDTTNGNWSTVWTTLADGGADASTMSAVSQYKTVTSTGNQSWECTTATGRDSARTYLIIYPAADTVDDLLADDVQSTSNVSAPVIGQVHVLNASDVQSTSNVTSPVLGQVHVLNAADIESSSQVSAPVLGISHTLLANDVESASQVSAPVIGQTHALSADDVQSTSQVTSPAITQVHGLLAADVESVSQVTTPTLRQVHVLSAVSVSSTSNVSTPSITEIEVTHGRSKLYRRFDEEKDDEEALIAIINAVLRVA